MADIMVYGLTQNNLKHVTFRIPKEKNHSIYRGVRVREIQYCL